MSTDTVTAEQTSESQANLTLPVKELGGKTNGTVDLPAEIFDVTANIALMHQVVVAQQAAARQGTHATKTRGQVSGGGKKPYRQKGTGRARQGSTRAPQFTGGGTVHGPQPRDYTQRLPKKMKAAALRGALSDRLRHDRIHVITELVAGQTPSTKLAKTFLAELSDRKKFLIVVGREDIAAWKSVANLQGVHPIAPDQLNTYDVLNSDEVVFSVEALNTFVHGPSESDQGVSVQDAATQEEAQ
jgi:large subunit ribosomal protein L4